MTQLQPTVHQEALGPRYLMMGNHRGRLEYFGETATLQDAMELFNARYQAVVHGHYSLEWAQSDDIITDHVYQYEPVWHAWDGTCTTEYFIMAVERVQLHVQ